jgi:prolyl oligopeptidase
MRYPPTATVDQVDDYHGVRVADPYRWLEDTTAAETREWITVQQAVTEEWLRHVPTRAELRQRLTQLWDHPRRGAPWRRGDRWFQLRNTGLQAQDVLWTMPAPDVEGEVLVDPNTWSQDGTAALTGMASSLDGEWLAYARSDRGSDWMTWRVRHVATATDKPDVVEWSKFAGAAWAPDASGFYYGAYDPPAEGQAYQQVNRNQRLCFHRLGDDQSADAVVYERPDEPDWGFQPSVSEDGRWLIVTVWQGTDPRTRIYIADLRGDGRVRPLLDAFDAEYQVIGAVDTTLYVLTDNDAPNRRVVAVDVDRPQPADWTEIVAESGDAIEFATLVGGHVFAASLHHASHRLTAHPIDGGAPRDVPLGEHGSLADVSGRQDDRRLHFVHTTFTQPASVFSYDIDSDATAQVFAPQLPDTRDDLRTTQVFVASTGGVRIPLFLVHRADVDPRATGQPAPTILYGYGGFGISVTPAFRVPWLVWVERGGVLAVACLRGGGEYGKRWHDGGRLAHKQNVFDDAIACAQWLVDEGWSTTPQLAIQGGSNGGLLVGACLTQRPDLFGAGISEVGVLDMLRFHRFTIGWAWTSDYGDPDDPDAFKTLYAYSPLHRIRPGTAYPATLLVTGDHDDRVVPGHSFKFAAGLQAQQAGTAPVLLRVETSTGHGAGKPTSKVIDERADVLAFCEGVLKLRGAWFRETCGGPAFAGQSNQGD